MNGITDLPLPILGTIFNKIEWKDFKKLNLICKKFHKTIESNWKKRFLR